MGVLAGDLEAGGRSYPSFPLRMSRRIAVLGLGYVGLPVGVGFAHKFPGTLGFDIDVERVAELAAGTDRTGEVSPDELRASGLAFSSSPADLAAADFYVVTVPTPIDAFNRPDLGALRSASRMLGTYLKPGDIVVYESTVYPGVTEDVCGPVLEEASGLRAGSDFKLGYSPERINPGDREHRLASIRKIVAGQDAEALEIVADCYGQIIDAGVYRASSIQVAEAAKVIENVQRDLNIALMNELALIFDRMELDTQEVLDAAATKWNFHRYHPGLVGGHCIGVDPYYLTSKAEQLGIHPQVILAGRRINDGMGAFVASKTVKLLIQAKRSVSGARVAVLGMSFKPNVPDIRNSRVPDIIAELRGYGVEVLACDPLVNPEHVAEEYGLELVPYGDLTALDAVILATPHATLCEALPALVREQQLPVLVDVLGALQRTGWPDSTHYWRL